MDNNWIYYGIFFDSDTKAELLKTAKKYAGIPEDWKVYCDHMTIVYNDGSEEKQAISNGYFEKRGVIYELAISSIGISDEAIALKVSNFITQNKVSHITIATAPGVKPVKSNDIVNWYALPEMLVVKGYVNAVFKK